MKRLNENNYPVILRILGFQVAPHSVGEYIIPGSKSLPPYHRVGNIQVFFLVVVWQHGPPCKTVALVHKPHAVVSFWEDWYLGVNPKVSKYDV